MIKGVGKIGEREKNAGLSTCITPHPRLREHGGRGGARDVRAGGGGELL